MTITFNTLEEIIRNKFPKSKTKISDYVGDGAHYSIEIEDISFKGLTLLEQHRLVKKVLTESIDDCSLHAVTIKTKVPF